MNELTATKNDFVADLVLAGLQVETVAFIPERITPPVVVIRPGGNYLTPSVLGAKEWQLALEADLIAATAGNQMVEEELDALIVAFIEALPTYARLVTVSAPTGLQTGNAEYLSATVNLEIAINLTPTER